jgi:F-type H+-transporting ATPase subunit epsilon
MGDVFMTPFNLRIVTPEGTIFPKTLKDGSNQQVLNVIVRTTVGDKGILARHEPYVASLPIGIMRVMDKSGKYRRYAISEGTIRVEEGGDTLILVGSCERSDRLDLARSEEMKAVSEKALENPDISEVERDIAEHDLKRAINRINAVNPPNKN